MKLATVEYRGEKLVGTVAEIGFYPFREYDSMISLIRSAGENGVPALQGKLTGDHVPMDEVKLLAPIPKPSHDLICLGMNFADHTEEARKLHPNMIREDYAVYFSKRVNEAVPDGGVIDSHRNLTEKLDYEAEVAVIIGRDAYHVPKEEAKDYVFGYTIINDVSAREVQTRHKQFYFGKSLDRFTPMGPYIVTKDEFSFPPEITVRSRVNGELRQTGNTSQWIYGIDAVITDLSQGITLEAGTVIAMGTPAGVGMGFDPPKYLKPGDTVECEVEGIGTLINTIK